MAKQYHKYRPRSSTFMKFTSEMISVSFNSSTLHIFKSITKANFSASIPAGSYMYPEESDKVNTFAPSWVAFSQAYCATFPEPEITTVFPSKLSPLSLAFVLQNTRYHNPLLQDELRNHPKMHLYR